MIINVNCIPNFSTFSAFFLSSSSLSLPSFVAILYVFFVNTSDSEKSIPKASSSSFRFSSLVLSLLASTPCNTVVNGDIYTNSPPNVSPINSSTASPVTVSTPPREITTVPVGTSASNRKYPSSSLNCFGSLLSISPFLFISRYTVAPLIGPSTTRPSITFIPVLSIFSPPSSFVNLAQLTKMLINIINNTIRCVRLIIPLLIRFFFFINIISFLYPFFSFFTHFFFMNRFF